MAAPRARCPRRLHHGARVAANGTYTRQTRAGDVRRYRRYRCAPSVGRPHHFSVLIAARDARPFRQPAPACPEHPGSRTQRDGSYGAKDRKKARQRYRCFPAGGVSPTQVSHAFTPRLPREHVHPLGEACDQCSEFRGRDRGESSSARRHRWNARTVARGLDQLSLGSSYGEVGKWALRTSLKDPSGPRRAVPPPSKDGEQGRVSRASAESHNAWRIGANWVEAHAAVIWEPIETRLREHALAERARLDADRAAGLPLDRPLVLLLDDKPVWARQAGRATKRRDGGFYLLVAGEVTWESPGPRDECAVARENLRLIRAFALTSAPAWRLVLDELGYRPDFVVADAAPGIIRAIGDHYGDATRLVPSLWHLARAIRLKLAGSVSKKRRLDPAIAAHLAELRRGGVAVTSPADWSVWWDELEEMATKTKATRDQVVSSRHDYEEPMLKVLPDLLANPGIPMSTGGLEILMRERVERVLVGRTQFANIERTNSLFDLVVARSHHAFDDLAVVADQLRTDARAHEGWTVTLRVFDDPRPDGPEGRKNPYRSLRDATLLRSLARSRGLT